MDNRPPDSREWWRTIWRDVREKLFPRMRPDAQRDIRRNFESALDDDTLWQVEACLIHGDFGAGNILYQDGHISGSIDFGFCGLDDPAKDLGALLASYGDAFVERLLRHYPALRASLPRARFYTGNYALIQALYAIRDDDPASFADGMAAYV